MFVKTRNRNKKQTNKNETKVTNTFSKQNARKIDVDFRKFEKLSSLLDLKLNKYGEKTERLALAIGIHNKFLCSCYCFLTTISHSTLSILFFFKLHLYLRTILLRSPFIFPPKVFILYMKSTLNPTLFPTQQVIRFVENIKELCIHTYICIIFLIFFIYFTLKFVK